MSNALHANEPVRELLYLPGLPLYDQDFQTVVMVEMRVGGSNDHLMMIVLQADQLLRQQPVMVIVDECYRPDHLSLRRLKSSVYQPVADEVTKCLRPIGVALPGNETVKSSEKIGVYGHPYPSEL